ncbi:MAG: hypothetical protein AAGJ93_15530 [Bacteroidota bacterium]
MTVNDLKTHIISVISDINDIEVLKHIKYSVDVIKETDQGKSTLSFEDGITTIRSGVSADEIFAEQGNKSITYSEIREITRDIEWEVSLEELLENLD